MLPMLVGEFYMLFKLCGDSSVRCMLLKSHMMFAEIDRYP